MKKNLFVFFLMFGFLVFNVAFGYSNGTLDTSFVSGLDSGSGANGVYLQSDGKAIVIGDFEKYTNVSRNRIARVNSDGTLDTTFNPGTGANFTVITAAIQSDGKIMIGGNFTTYNGISRNRIARVNSDGTLDTTFNPGQGLNGEVRTVSVQADGKVIVGGNFSTYDGDIAQKNILRLNSDGTLDSSFQTGSGATGTIDSDTAIVYASLIEPSGKIIIAGDFYKYDNTVTNRIARLNTDGTIDTTFVPGTGTNGGILGVARQSDGKVLIGGVFTTYNGTARNNIARLNSDGSLDTTFNPGTGDLGEVHHISLQADQKIMVAGYFTKYNDVARNNIVRVNADGTLDTSFNSSTGTNSAVFSTAHQTDTKILIAGRFTTYNGTNSFHLARLGDTVTPPPPPPPNTTPAPTTAPDMTAATDTGSSNTDNITTDATPDFATTCISGSLVTLYIDGVAIPQTGSCVNGVATITLVTPLTTSSHNVTYTQKVNNIESGYAPALPIVISNDDAGPFINGISIIGQNASSTPAYTFTSSEAGTIIYGGACSSTTTNASYGFNNIIFKPLNAGLYTNCTIKVVDATGNMSNVITIASFTVTQSNQPNNQNLSTEGCTAFTAYSPLTGNKCPIVNNSQNTFVDTNPVFCPHFTQYLKLNSRVNDTNEAKRWQKFLNDDLNAGLVIDGKFGPLSFQAVKNFQAKYITDILLPWGITTPTGYIYKSTRAKANSLFGCSEGVVELDNGVIIRR